MTIKNNLFALTLVVALAGCAAPALTVSDTLPASSGFVMVRVVTNTASVDPSMNYGLNRWNSVGVIDQTGKSYRLLPSIGWGRVGSQVFVAPLPAGEYQLDHMQVSFAREVRSDLRHLGSFNVRSGQATTLGTLVYQPAAAGKHVVIFDPAQPAATELLNVEYPAIGKAVAGNAMIKSVPPAQKFSDMMETSKNSGAGGLTVALINAAIDNAAVKPWQPDWKNVVDSQSAMWMAKLSSAAFNDPQQLDNGEIYAGSNLGQVLKRDVQGNWNQFDLSDVREVLSINVIDSSNILVGGEDGLLSMTADGGKTWTALKAPVHGSVIGIGRIGRECYVLMSTNGSVVLYHTANMAQSDWRELQREDGLGGPEGIYGWRKGGLTLTENKVFFYTAKPTLRSLDRSTGQWQNHPNLGGHIPTAMKVISPGKIQLSTMQHDYISDGTSSPVIPIKNDCTSFSSTPGPRGSAYNLCIGGSFVASASIRRRDNAQSGWHKIVEQTVEPTNKIFVGRDGLLLQISLVGVIHASTDQGKTWKRERPLGSASGIKPPVN